MIKKPNADRHAAAATDLFAMYGQWFESAHAEQRTRHAPYPANETFRDGFVSGAALTMYVYEGLGIDPPKHPADDSEKDS